MKSSRFASIQSKLKGHSLNIQVSIDNLRRRCKSLRDDTSSGFNSAAPSPTSSAFSKKSIFGKKLWKGRRESRDDFGNRWSKIYLPGYSRSATPLPDIFPSVTRAASEGAVEAHEDEGLENEVNFVNTITNLGYLEMLYDDELFEVGPPPQNSPYLISAENNPKRWLSWTSLHHVISRPSTRGMQKTSVVEHRS